MDGNAPKYVDTRDRIAEIVRDRGIIEVTVSLPNDDDHAGECDHERCVVIGGSNPVEVVQVALSYMTHEQLDELLGEYDPNGRFTCTEDIGGEELHDLYSE